MSKILIAYFSHAGENLIENKVVNIGNEGNTEKAAKALKDSIMNLFGEEADLYQIKTKEPYPASYQETADRAQKEKEEDARPEIEEGPADFDSYNVVFVGYPNWWGTCPQAVLTFTSTHSFKGKIIVPFVTHGGQIFLYSIDDIKATLDGGEVVKGFACAATYIDKASAVTDSWVSKNLHKLV